MKRNILMAAAAALVLTACPVIDTVEYGSLIMGFGSADMQPRTIVPSISMDITYYNAHGDGPNSATFDQTGLALGSSIVESSLEVGSWLITADAYNASAQQIGTGNVPVVIQAGQTATASVIVTPLTGNGTLSVVINWPSFPASILAVALRNAGGLVTASSSDEQHATATATYTWVDIAAGYYWLNIQLGDSAGTKWGANESVRIVGGQTTTGTFTLDAIDLETGMSVLIVPQMRNPVAITIEDYLGTEVVAESTVSIVEDNSIDVSVTDPAAAEWYQWHIDGALELEGDFATAANLVKSFLTGTAGMYRVDVGIKTGTGVDEVLSSKTFNVEVSAAP